MDAEHRPTATSSRRAFLGTAVVGAVGLAGCIGGEPGEGAAEPPVTGDPAADVTLESFEDFSCGACRLYTLEGYPLLEGSHVEPGLIRYEFRNFPFEGQQSNEAANAARAAFVEGGDDAFWEFKTRVMEAQPQLSPGATGLYGDIAEEVGIERDPIETAAANLAYDDAVSADRSRGEDMGVDRTPSFAIDGELVDTGGASTMEQLVGIVQNELDSALEDADGGGGY